MSIINKNEQREERESVGELRERRLLARLQGHQAEPGFVQQNGDRLLLQLVRAHRRRHRLHERARVHLQVHHHLQAGRRHVKRNRPAKTMSPTILNLQANPSIRNHALPPNS